MIENYSGQSRFLGSGLCVLTIRLLIFFVVNHNLETHKLPIRIFAFISAYVRPCHKMIVRTGSRRKCLRGFVVLNICVLLLFSLSLVFERGWELLAFSPPAAITLCRQRALYWTGDNVQLGIADVKWSRKWLARTRTDTCVIWLFQLLCRAFKLPCVSWVFPGCV